MNACNCSSIDASAGVVRIALAAVNSLQYIEGGNDAYFTLLFSYSKALTSAYGS
jgi:hypothetical protein